MGGTPHSVIFLLIKIGLKTAFFGQKITNYDHKSSLKAHNKNITHFETKVLVLNCKINSTHGGTFSKSAEKNTGCFFLTGVKVSEVVRPKTLLILR